jgi:hypothetical protein
MEPPLIGNTPDQHVDQVKYVVRLTRHPSGGIKAVREGWVVIWGEMDVPLDQAARLSSAVAWDPKHEVYEAFVAEQSYTQFEWGASGYGVSFLVDVVSSVSSELVVAGLTYAVTNMRGKKRRDAPWAPSIDDMETVGVDATRAVEAVFREEHDDLTVEEATRVGEAVQVRVRGIRGAYIVTLTALETGDPLCHVRRADDAH